MQETSKFDEHSEPFDLGFMKDLTVGRVLNITGVAFLVLGAMLLLCFSWHFLGAELKIGIGGFGAYALVMTGHVLANRHRDVGWFGQGLIGGGYALGYFVVYAMHNIASVKVLDSAVIDLALLLVLSVVSMWHAVKERSQIVAMLCSALSIVTISLNPVSLFSIAACALVSAGIAIAIARMRWYRLHLLSAIASYLTFGLFTAQNVIGSTATAANPPLLALAFLAVAWLSHLLASLALAKDNEQAGMLATSNIINAILFVGLGLHTLAQNMEGMRYLFLNVVGATYIRSAHLYRLRSSAFADLSKFTGLTLVTAAIPLELMKQAVPVVYMVEVALLVYAGLKFDQIVLRVFAWLLAIHAWCWLMFDVLHQSTLITLRGITFEWSLLVGTMALISYGVALTLYRLPQFKSVQKQTEVDVVPPMLYILITVTALAMPLVIASNQLCTIVWPLTGIGLIAGGFKFAEKTYRLTGLTFFVLVAAKLLLFDLASVNTIQRALSFFIAGIAFLAGSYAYVWLGKKYTASEAVAS